MKARKEIITVIMLILMAITKMMIFSRDKYNDYDHFGDNNEAESTYYATKYYLTMIMNRICTNHKNTTNR